MYARPLQESGALDFGVSGKLWRQTLVLYDRAQVNGYKDFVDEYELAADRLVKAASQGRRLDPFRHFPTGSFPPAVIDQLLKAASGFS